MKYSGPPKMNAVGTVCGVVGGVSELFAMTSGKRKTKTKELNYFMANITVTDNVVFVRNELNGPQSKHKSGN